MPIPENTEPISFIWSPRVYTDYPISGYYIRSTDLKGNTAKLFVGDVVAYTLYVNIGETNFFALVPYYDIYVPEDPNAHQDVGESQTIEITGQPPTDKTRTFIFKFPEE